MSSEQDPIMDMRRRTEPSNQSNQPSSKLKPSLGPVRSGNKLKTIFFGSVGCAIIIIAALKFIQTRDGHLFSKFGENVVYSEQWDSLHDNTWFAVQSQDSFPNQLSFTWLQRKPTEGEANQPSNFFSPLRFRKSDDIQPLLDLSATTKVLDHEYEKKYLHRILLDPTMNLQLEMNANFTSIPAEVSEKVKDEILTHNGLFSLKMEVKSTDIASLLPDEDDIQKNSFDEVIFGSPNHFLWYVHIFKIIEQLIKILD